MATKAPLPKSCKPEGPAWPRHNARPWMRRHRPPLSPDMLLAAIPSFPRPVLARLTERLIDRMDEEDGNPDVEANGDELDGSMGEDDFHYHGQNWLGLPGCPVSDPGEDNHDAEAEQTYD